jgi:hypothetical protein
MLLDQQNKRRLMLARREQEMLNKAAPEKRREMKPEDFTKPFCDFLTACPTVFHAVDWFGKRLASQGFQKVDILFCCVLGNITC